MQERRKLCNLVSLQALKVNRAVSIAREPSFRFAPSPNGLLHLGHAYSAILTYEMAKKHVGELYLRIEDIDGARSQESFSTAIIRDLHWLGIEWQTPVIYQSDHFEIYSGAIRDLIELELLYPCFASRKEIKQALERNETIRQDPDGAPLYPALYKYYPKAKAEERIASGEPFALRLHMDKAIDRAKQLNSDREKKLAYQAITIDCLIGNEGDTPGSVVSNRRDTPGCVVGNRRDSPGCVVGNRRDNKEQQLSSIPLAAERWGDVVIKRKDTPTSYHLSVVIDDDKLGITHICRGKDLEAATDIHRILQINLGLAQPIYHHHDLVLYNNDKLSKSKGHPSLFELRENGVNPLDIYKSALIGPSELSKYLP